MWIFLGLIIIYIIKSHTPNLLVCTCLSRLSLIQPKFPTGTQAAKKRLLVLIEILNPGKSPVPITKSRILITPRTFGYAFSFFHSNPFVHFGVFSVMGFFHLRSSKLLKLSFFTCTNFSLCFLNLLSYIACKR